MKMLSCFVKDRLLIKAMRIEKAWDVHKLIAKFAEKQ